MEQLTSSENVVGFLARSNLALQEAVLERGKVQVFRSFDRRRPDRIPDELFRLRYDVYCIERAFLQAESFLDGMESDDYDDSSTHFAAYTNGDALVGTVRLVTPEEGCAYPFELHCSVFPDFVMPPRHACGEISRLAVRRTHRRRRADCMRGIPGFAEMFEPPVAAAAIQERRDPGSPMLLLGMYREIYRHSRANGIRYWFAAMERSLAHSLRKIGFRFKAIGPVSDYYGKVTPYILDLGEIIPELSAHNPPLSAWFDELPPRF